MCVAKRNNVIGVGRQQSFYGSQALFPRALRFIGERDFTQPGDKSIGSFGVCGPVEHQRIASLVMHLLNLADKHLSRVVQRLRHLLAVASSASKMRA